jgi:hypothetical protein
LKQWTIAQQTVVLLEKSLGPELSNLERRKQLLERIQSWQISKAVKKMMPLLLFVRIAIDDCNP